MKNDLYRNALLLIDAQNDFCEYGGSLYVKGAGEDMDRLSEWLTKNGARIDRVFYSMDSHGPRAIFHPVWFEGADGAQPEPMTQIAAADVESGKWKPRFHPEHTLHYLQELERNSPYKHTIWPEHCIVGSMAHLLDMNVADALWNWSGEYQRAATPVVKGLNPLTEHYGIFRAEVPLDDAPETQLNRRLLDELDQYDRVFVAGEAASHCVAASLMQIVEHAPELAPKLEVLTDCSSSIAGFEASADNARTRVREAGGRLSTVDSVSF